MLNNVHTHSHLHKHVDMSKEHKNQVLELLGLIMGFPSGSDNEESACNARCPGLIHGLGRSPGEGNCKPLQCSCLENPMDTGAWQAAAHKVTQSDTTEAT